MFSDELKRSLPAILVEILEERLQTEQINGVIKLADQFLEEVRCPSGILGMGREDKGI